MSPDNKKAAPAGTEGGEFCKPMHYSAIIGTGQGKAALEAVLACDSKTRREIALALRLADWEPFQGLEERAMKVKAAEAMRQKGNGR